DTYFGRDTLMSVRLLMPALTARAIDDALDSVLARLSPHGQVAHEELIGEEAVLENLKQGVRSARPSYTYLMIDENYMLAPDAAAWLLSPRGRARAAAYLAAPVGGPLHRRISRGAALVKNLVFVLESASAFAHRPEVAHLIGLKPGMSAGDWRDSNAGLGGGHYPYDVNAALVPAALEA
ncbi:lipoprotein, partial [mine drainage metagenome]